MLNLNDTIKIGPAVFQVIERTDLRNAKNDKKILAQIHIDLSTIEVEVNQSRQSLLHSLWHEILHGVLAQAGYPAPDHCEARINLIAYGIIEVLRDNPWITTLERDFWERD